MSGRNADIEKDSKDINTRKSLIGARRNANLNKIGVILRNPGLGVQQRVNI